MRKNRTKKSLTQHGGYFKAPDFIFDLPLSEHAKLIVLYLCRRSDSQGLSFPSLERIGKDCSIKSRTTSIKALKELYKAGLIIKDNSKRASNTYQLLEQVLHIIKAKKEHSDTLSYDEHLPVH